MSGPPLLAARALCAKRGSFSLKNISLNLRPGRLLAVIGPNGGGKSTLLRCLSGGLKNHSGSIKINGAEINSLPPKKLAQNLAAVLQNPARPRHMTVGEYALLGRYPRLGLLGFFSASDYKAAEECLALCGIENLKDREAGTLSGGEWQKAALCRALCQIHGVPEPVLILDEITASMDPAKALETFRLLKSLSNAAVIAAVHDCNLAALFASSVMGLKNGEQLFYGKVHDVFTPENLSKLYNMPAGVFLHPDTGLPQLYPRLPASGGAHGPFPGKAAGGGVQPAFSD